jgi:hypothetical protein
VRHTRITQLVGAFAGPAGLASYFYDINLTVANFRRKRSNLNPKLPGNKDLKISHINVRKLQVNENMNEYLFRHVAIRMI